MAAIMLKQAKPALPTRVARRTAVRVQAASTVGGRKQEIID